MDGRFWSNPFSGDVVDFTVKNCIQMRKRYFKMEDSGDLYNVL